jgi:hypothetical protein
MTRLEEIPCYSRSLKYAEASRMRHVRPSPNGILLRMIVGWFWLETALQRARGITWPADHPYPESQSLRLPVWAVSCFGAPLIQLSIVQYDRLNHINDIPLRLQPTHPLEPRACSAKVSLLPPFLPCTLSSFYPGHAAPIFKSPVTLNLRLWLQFVFLQPLLRYQSMRAHCYGDSD